MSDILNIIKYTYLKHYDFKLISKPWTESVDKIKDRIDIDIDEGLNSKEVQIRQEKYGKNELKESKRRSNLSILIEQFKSILVLILVLAVLVSYFFEEYIEAIAISAVIIINSLIGFYTEHKAVRSMDALKEMVKTEARVTREGELQKVPSSDLVPGDIVEVIAGDIVSADIRLFEASKLRVDESTLTGESVPVDKKTEVIGESPLAERTNMLYKGTSVTRGSGKGIVMYTGLDTEVGKISELVEEAGTAQETPLENKLDDLGRNLVWLSMIIISLIIIAGLYRGQDLFLLIETALALAVATVPEGLPIVATITLARGMKRMADRNALISKLSAVETLGSVNVIATDKTGTLTENQMTVTSYLLVKNAKNSQSFDVTGLGLNPKGDFKVNGKNIDVNSHPILKKAVEIGVLCNNSSLNHDDKNDKFTSVGDPTETALLVAGEKAGIDRKEFLKSNEEIREVSFDPNVMMMATYNKIPDDDSLQVMVKGSPPEVIERCTHIYQNGEFDEDAKKSWIEENDEMAKNGLRVLALATKSVSSVDEEPYTELRYIGLVGLVDPPRMEVRETIDTIGEAGIKLTMVTGDQRLTAINIAETLEFSNGNPKVLPGSRLQDYESLTEEDIKEILETDIFYRVEPREKLNLVKIFQEKSNIIAMTGDGVNDAPALRKADIGVSMGLRGTQVAKESADMILNDDNFNTIGIAISEGRDIFKNIQKFIYYLLSCNVSEILIIFFATLFALPLPILPIQILYLNIVTDVFPAFALSMNDYEDRLMKEPPRDPDEQIITNRQWAGITIFGLILTFTVLSGFVYALIIQELSLAKSVTIGFLTLGIAQLFHVFNMRDSQSNFFNNSVTENKNVWYAILVSILLIFTTVYIPFLGTYMHTVPLNLSDLSIVFSFSLIPVIIGFLVDPLDVK